MRKIKPEELTLLKCLLKAHIDDFPTLSELLVVDKDDGGMGSLLIVDTNREGFNNRIYGSTYCQKQFLDDDGVKVLVSLELDDKGSLFELDIWKTNFDRLKKYPTTCEELINFE